MSHSACSGCFSALGFFTPVVYIIISHRQSRESCLYASLVAIVMELNVVGVENREVRMIAARAEGSI